MDENVSGEKQASPADRIKRWQFKPGQSGNPKGRPKSPITRIKEIWKENPEDFDEWITEYMEKEKKHVVEMVEGKPQQKTDITTNGKELPAPIIKLDVLGDNSASEDSEAE